MFKDCWGRPLKVGDPVRVTAYGYGARLVDCGIITKVVRVSRTRVVIIDSDQQERAVKPGVVLKLTEEAASA